MSEAVTKQHEPSVAAPSRDEAPRRLSRWQTAALAAVCLSAVGVRLLFAFWSLPPLESDFYWYREAGLAASRHGLMSLFSADPPVPMWVLSLWPPGYPLFLGLLYSINTSIWAAPVAQAVMGGASCLLIFSAARRWGGNPWVAAAIMAFHPHAVVYAAVHGAEALTLFLLSLAIAASVTPLGGRQAFVYGAGLGLSILTRCHVLFIVPGVIASLWRRWRTLAIVLGSILVALLPWSISRSLVYHRPVLMTTFFGHLLYMGNRADNPTGGYREAPRPVEIPGNVTAPEEDVYFTAAGVREIMLHPGHYVMVSARRMLVWTGVDRDEWMLKYAPRWMVGLALVVGLAVFFAAVAAGVECWRAPEARYVLWPVISLVLLTALTYHMPRYTLVALPYFALIAARFRADVASGAADARPSA